MLSVVRKTRHKFTLLILMAMFTVSSMMYFGLQYASVTQINRPLSTTELHEHVKDNDALHAYVESQKEYEAHFITLANKVRSEDSRRISDMVAIFAIVSIVIGSAAALVLSKILMKPVTEAYISQERFLQDAAHELRNPLAALTVALQQHGDGKNSARLNDTYRRQTRRLVSITEDLLFIERKTRGDAQVYDISELLQDVIEELKPMARSAGIKLNVESDTISKTIVVADYVRMVKNLVDNAIKYSPANSIVTISQKLIKSQITITVIDQGIGIPANQLKDVGKRFFRANNVGTREGTGLGLAIVQKIVYLYGGRFSIHSTEHGTTAMIQLPK